MSGTLSLDGEENEPSTCHCHCHWAAFWHGVQGAEAKITGDAIERVYARFGDSGVAGGVGKSVN